MARESGQAMWDVRQLAADIGLCVCVSTACQNGTAACGPLDKLQPPLLLIMILFSFFIIFITAPFP